MAHEVEQIVYVSNEENGRFVPWHGLGTPVAAAMTSQEALELGGLNWDVISQPIYTNGIEIPGYKANVRSIDGKVLGVVGDRYKIIQNSEAFAFTDALIGDNCRYETAGSLMGGKRIFLLARLPDHNILGDSFENYVCFTNGHDGKNSVKACVTPIRVVCQNTLNLALNGAARSWTTRHVGNIESKIEEARHTLELATEYINELSVTADMLANTRVSEDQVREVLNNIYPTDSAATDRQKASIQEKKDAFMEAMNAPDLNRFEGTAWQVVNAASDYATHKMPHKNTAAYDERNFNKVLDGHIIIDTFTLAMMNIMNRANV